jgi:HK97 gp10 family phage protein
MPVEYTTKIPALIGESEAKASMIIRKAAFDILADAHRTVPVKTGHLKASGNVEADGLTATIRFDADYAAYVELGTRHMPPRPYLRPAFDRIVPVMMQALKTVAE